MPVFLNKLIIKSLILPLFNHGNPEITVQIFKTVLAADLVQRGVSDYIHFAALRPVNKEIIIYFVQDLMNQVLSGIAGIHHKIAYQVDQGAVSYYSSKCHKLVFIKNANCKLAVHYCLGGGGSLLRLVAATDLKAHKISWQDPVNPCFHEITPLYVKTGGPAPEGVERMAPQEGADPVPDFYYRKNYTIQP